MWGMLAAAAVYVPVALLALDRGWGIRGVWLGLAGLIGVRLVTCAGAFREQPLGADWRSGSELATLPGVMRIRFAVLIAALALLVAGARRARAEQPVRRVAARAAHAGADRRARRTTASNDQTSAATRSTSSPPACWSRSSGSASGSRATRAATCRRTSATTSNGRSPDEIPHKHERKAKAKARAKGRAQRQARKAHRKKARR